MRNQIQTGNEYSIADINFPIENFRMRKDSTGQKPGTYWSKYKGAMSKQSLSDIDQQLNELRNEWE